MDKIEFSRNVEELMSLLKLERKGEIVRYLQKNFKEDVHYTKNNKNVIKHRGGHNKINYELTENVFELVLNSYNLKNRYLPVIMNTPNLNIIMSLENQTIGFIENSFNGVINTKRQYIFPIGKGKYIVDLYFPSYNLIIECDENNHVDRDVIYEKTREQHLLLEGNTIIRFNPNAENFDLSIVLKEINKVLFSNNNTNHEIINCIFI